MRCRSGKARWGTTRRLSGAAAAWPLAVHAQQPDRMRRIGVLMAYDESDPGPKGWLSRFTKGLQELGWTDGGNLRMDVRWAGDSVERLRSFAKDLVDLQPDVILATGTLGTAALQRETRTIPIVFVPVADPVGSGFVDGLSRPGGNITGFISYEASLAGKWLQLLTEIAPGIKRVAIMFNPDTAVGGGSYYLPSFEAAARTLKVEPIAAPVHSDAEIAAAITSLGRETGGGLVLMPDSCRPSRANHIAGSPIQCSGDLQFYWFRQRRRSAFLRTRQLRSISSRRFPRRSHPARSKAGGPAG
jgi:putative tryptophan/tyrosine transport system substrate-binding protein